MTSEEEIIEMPCRIVERSSGLSFDIGATLVKCIYRSKKEYRMGKPIPGQGNATAGRLHSILFLRSQIAEFIDYVKQNCDLTPQDGSTCAIYATGCGTSQFKYRLERELNIKINLIGEWDVFLGAFRYFLVEMPPDKAVLEPSKLGLADAQLLIAQFQEIMQKMLSMTPLSVLSADAEPSTAEPSTGAKHMPAPDDVTTREPAAETRDREMLTKPAMLIICGSSVNMLQVGRTGNAVILEMSSKSGSTFVGLGCLLLRENKTFSELIALAEQGDERRMDICGKDLKPETNQGDVYSMQADDVIICRFGRATTAAANSFRPEDMLASLLQMICQDLITMAFSQARLNKLDRLYFAGNFALNDHVRRVLTCEFESRNAMFVQMSGGAPIELRFMRYGGFLGAIGSMLQGSGEAETAE